MVEEGILTTEKDERWVKKVIDKIVRPRGFSDIRANIDGYEAPAKLSRANDSDDEAFIPDITAVSHGRKSYFEIATKTDRTQEVISKWQLLSRLANFKSGKLFLIAPRGHVAFTERLLKQYDITAELIRL
jgi:hypothetical protein